MKWKLFIYRENDIKTYVTEKAFNSTKEIEDMLIKYEGFWCRVVDLSTLEIMLEGAFDNDFLNEEYYKQPQNQDFKGEREVLFYV